jgi:hypothetical protein
VNDMVIRFMLEGGTEYLKKIICLQSAEVSLMGAGIDQSKTLLEKQ